MLTKKSKLEIIQDRLDEAQKLINENQLEQSRDKIIQAVNLTRLEFNTRNRTTTTNNK